LLWRAPGKFPTQSFRPMSLRPSALFLLPCLALAVAGAADRTEPCDNGVCQSGEDEHAALLQSRMSEKMEVVDGGAAGGEQQFPLEFQYFVGADTGGVFRVQITASIDGLSYHLLLDTGSSTIGLCNGTTDANDTFVPPSVPMPDGTPTGDAIAVMYGGCPGAHGWWGDGYTGTLTVGKVSTPTGYAVMQQKTGLRGNQCGLPLDGSLGAERLQGIFGFAGTKGNGPWCPGATYTIDEIVNCSTAPCSVTPTPETAPFQSILTASGSDAFSISWSGMFGAGSGTLYTADASRLRLAQVSQTAGVRVQMTWEETYYMITPTGYALYTGPDFQELVTGSVAAPKCAGECIVDTGSPQTNIPPATFEALVAHFNVSDAPARITIELVGVDGSPVQLNLLVPSWMGDPNYLNAVFVASDAGMISLANWLWYEEAHFDVANGEVVFVPRDNITEFLDELRGQVESA